MHGLTFWFQVTFAKGDEEKPLVLSISPFYLDSNWKQALLYLMETVQVEQGRTFQQRSRSCPPWDNPLHLCILLCYKVGN